MRIHQLIAMIRGPYRYGTLLAIVAVSLCLIYFTHATDTFFGDGDSVCRAEDGCEVADSTSPTTQGGPENEAVAEIHILITFTNAKNNLPLKNKFTVTVSSIFQYATTPLVIYIIGESASYHLAEEIIRKNAGNAVYRVEELDVDQLAKDLDVIIRPMQHHFSAKKGAYYNHALFFLSIAMHRVMPETLHRVIMLDADLRFRDDITKLFNLFSEFSDTNVMGIARENQPVYRHTFWQFRKENPGTRVAGPPPDGLTGFNSGVLLLDLDKMRRSSLYNSVINEKSVGELTAEFHFKGHLGDQDFFTLLNMKYEELFYVLPCEWNRQLCTWWKNKGYEDVFDQYYNCDAETKIYHGNCNTPIPAD